MLVNHNEGVTMRGKVKLSISDLIAELRRRRKLVPLMKQKAKRLEAQLAQIREEIKVLEGADAALKRKPVAAVNRGRNKVSLSRAILSVLSKDKPKSVKNIIEDVLKSGYKTTSRNFSTIVYQTLNREKKHIEKAGRGLYRLKG